MIVNWISQRMVEAGIIKKEDIEIYQFGIRNGLLIFLNLITAIVIGILTSNVIVVAIFTLSFMTLRSYTGGYHLNSKVLCYLLSGSILFIPVSAQHIFINMKDIYRLGILISSVCFIVLASPMDSNNRKLDQEEKKCFGKKARIILVIQLTIFGILYYLEQKNCAFALYSSTFVIALFMLFGKVHTVFLQLNKT